MLLNGFWFGFDFGAVVLYDLVVEIKVLIGIVEAELLQDEFAEIGAEECMVEPNTGQAIEEVHTFEFFAN